MSYPVAASGQQTPSTPAPSPVGGNGRPSRHERDGSDLERQPDGALLFRVRCTCGWRSEPVPMARTILVWEDHWISRTR